jgi:cell division septation protein DedD
MDIANYLSELLGQHGEISVPGLGHFVHVRVSAWYNDAERKFYPPGYKIQFNPQIVDGDDTLTRYIAEKKKISLASSKYFTDKYINSLKQEAALQEVPFADLGWFFMDKGKIAFKSKISNADNASFYGYAPVGIKKLNQPAAPEVTVETGTAAPEAVGTPVQATTAAVQSPEPLPLPPPIREILSEETVNQPEEYFDAEPEPRRSISTWAIVLIAIIILASAGLTIYKFKPQWLRLNKGQEMQLPPEPKATPVTKSDTDSVKKAAPPTDTIKKAILKPDSALKTASAATPPADSSTGPVFAVILGSFKTVKKAQAEADNYQRKGVDARVYSGPGTGKLIKVVTGSFATYDEAKAQKDRLVKEKKIEITSYPYQLVKHQK